MAWNTTNIPDLTMQLTMPTWFWWVPLNSYHGSPGREVREPSVTTVAHDVTRADRHRAPDD